MARRPKVSLPTQVVLDARKKYPELLEGAAAYLGSIPYMKQRLDPRTIDSRLLQMTPEQMTQLAYTDPMAAEAAAKRISDLEAKAPPDLPGSGEYEG